MRTPTTYTAKTGQTIRLAMSDRQETYAPHWLFRLTGDYIADAKATAKEGSPLKEVMTARDFFKVISDLLVKHEGCDLKAEEYDLQGKLTREEVMRRLKEVAEKQQLAEDSSNAKKSVAAVLSEIDTAFKAFKLAIEKKEAEEGKPMTEDRIKTAVLNNIKHDTKQGAQLCRDVFIALKKWNKDRQTPPAMPNEEDIFKGL